MSQIDPQSPSFDVMKAAAQEEAYTEALASVRDELVGLPREAVVAPVENVVEVVRRVLALVRAARPGASAEEEVQLARLEGLALALARAHHEYVWESPRKALPDYDRLVVIAERRFRDTEELVGHCVRRGRIERRLVPRHRGSTLEDRCDRAIELIALLHSHGVWRAWHNLDRTEALAYRLLKGKPMARGEVTPTELRDRAYTMLSLELASHEAKRLRGITEDSGVFAITDLCGPALARCA